jgi:hypothetical protein
MCDPWPERQPLSSQGEINVSSIPLLRWEIQWMYQRQSQLNLWDCTFIYIYIYIWGHAVAWLVEALCHKPEGYGIKSRWGGFFNLPNPSSRTMTLGSTQPLTEMSTSNLPGGKGWRARRADNLTAIYKPTVWKMWEPQHLTTLWASTASYRDSFTFIYIYI